MRTHHALLIALATACLATTARAAVGDVVLRETTQQTPIRVEVVAEGLDTPWGLAFLPDGRYLVTERDGRLRVIGKDGGLSAPVGGVPEVQARGQSGLLDVALAPDFAQSSMIYLSYSEPTSGGVRTAVARGVLDLEQLKLDKVERIFAQNEDPSGRLHWGSRLVFARDGTLFITLGDRYNHRDQAQVLSSHIGKIVRVQPDGTVPPDNPFVGRKDAAPEVWSYGHRNIQGAALHPRTGVLWTHEHGPQGGDEVNIGEAGANYGWPVITHGREYGLGTRIGEGTERADVKAALHVWIPSIAPSGMAFVTHDAIPGWNGSLLVGALRGQLLARLTLDGDKVVAEERLLTGLHARLRDVREGPDGVIYLLDESNGRILRVVADIRLQP